MSYAVAVLSVLLTIFSSESLAIDTLSNAELITVEKGVLSRLDNNERAHTLEIYNNEDWLAFWEEHKSVGVPGLPPELMHESAPYVNFDEYYIVVAMDQVRGSGGYLLEIASVEVDGANGNKPYTIVIKLEQPGHSVGTISLMTRPYHIVMIRR